MVKLGVHSGRSTILKVACWLRGTHLSSLERKRVRAHHVFECKYTEIEVGLGTVARTRQPFDRRLCQICLPLDGEEEGTVVLCEAQRDSTRLQWGTDPTQGGYIEIQQK